MSRHSWEVVCVEREDDPEFEDCRSVAELGYLVANRVRTAAVDVPYYQLRNDNAAYHVVVDGEERPLEPAMEGTRKYVRALPEDSADDPLLDLPTTDEYETEQRYEAP